MAKLKADFLADWIAYLRARLIQEGWSAAEVERLSDSAVPPAFFESRRRKLAQRPRLLNIADSFQCPAADLVGWTALQAKVIAGDNLNPHLSKWHARIDNPDGLLAEWQVHHFHLGVGPDPSDPSYVLRTNSLVFALVDDNTFCAINVYPHQTHWEVVDIIETIHRNWPDIISRYRVRGVTPAVLDNTQRRTLRRHNGNVLIGTQDGTVYMPIGGGVAASGAKIECVMAADNWCMKIQGLQASLEKELGQLIATFEQQGYAGEDEIEGQLKITDTGYRVFFPRYSVLANLQINEL
jgi:hypothetical protein